ncbi:signal peptidase II [Candidatus Woesearchaeota archaeon]|nr:signal peptidase II [Candidatus Woesearchaeota archaeon]MBI3037413.1 signal peptidase II [Candidatus Woesearchaeota archaeon]
MANTAVIRKGKALAAAAASPGYIPLFISVAALTALDQLTKAIIRGSLARSYGIDLPASLGLLQIVHITNTGSIFGVLKGTQLLISALSVAVVAFLIMAYRKLDKKLQRLGALLIIAGAVGNTIDRLLFGMVTDFIYLRPWPAFNLADTFLFFGAALLLLSLISLPSLPRWLLAVAAMRSGRSGQRKNRK